MLGRRALGWCVLLLLPTVGLGQSDRLQIRSNGEATLPVSGDVPEFGFGPSTLVYGWGICGDSGSCTRDYPWSILGFVARWGAGSGYSFSNNINLILHNNFIFDFSPPTFSIPNYTYSYKHSLGFIYFAQPLSVGSSDLITGAWCGPYSNPPPDCCSSSYATLDFSVALRTSVGEVAIGENLDSSCSAGENCGVNFEFIEWPTPYRKERGYKPYQVDLGTRQGSTVHHEKVEAVLQLGAFGTLCGAAGGTVGGSASTGIVLQSEPHPLGVPAIGENEYVWESDRPAKLTIRARAYAYTWGWEPDLGWLADKTAFRVEPEIPSDDTKPGVRTVARGRELVAQSLDGQTDGYVDGLLYRSKYLPPRNSDFGKKKVHFEVEGSKVDYAEVEVFYPANSTNHPNENVALRKRPVLTFPRPDCQMCTSTVSHNWHTPNWFYYYSQIYFSTSIRYGGPSIANWMKYGVACPLSGEVVIFDPVSPCNQSDWQGWIIIPLFIMNSSFNQIEFSGDFLYVRGIHKFISVVEHENIHLSLWQQGIDRMCFSTPDNDRDRDGLDDQWERDHGLNPMLPSTTGIAPDAEIPPLIHMYGAIMRHRETWRQDWAECGLQKGMPTAPFPFFYQYNRTGSPQPYLESMP